MYCVCALCFFSNLFIQGATNKPTIDELNEFVRPKVADRWYDVGMKLLSSLEFGVEKLNSISKNHPRDVEACCTDMFNFWLANVTDANWSKIVEAVKAVGQAVYAKELEKVSVYILNYV